jgi:hypothetical protein
VWEEGEKACGRGLADKPPTVDMIKHNYLMVRDAFGVKGLWGDYKRSI